MIYPATFEQKIGFDRLREQVAARCTMRAARERLAAEGFSTSAREIERRLLMQIQLLVHSINVYKQILENKVMTEDIFVLPPTDFIHVR